MKDDRKKRSKAEFQIPSIESVGDVLTAFYNKAKAIDVMIASECSGNCIKNLPGTMSACCGHGNIEAAYIKFLDGVIIRGHHAKTIQFVMKRSLQYHPSRAHNRDEQEEVTDGHKKE